MESSSRGVEKLKLLLIGFCLLAAPIYGYQVGQFCFLSSSLCPSSIERENERLEAEFESARRLSTGVIVPAEELGPGAQVIQDSTEIVQKEIVVRKTWGFLLNALFFAIYAFLIYVFGNLARKIMKK
jgi:hypothetical protein